ncbi:hypothetical protein BO85DRAFT_450750 [Aspergillus piperis CBS 112811]|uniref:Uncharacterized protein n=1 Tax=Aspergillus piperis CBS 112811 TaxID=1448313 RepID=A0A8G1QY80_9EURO|nr:hypothetical protein BO85DRAFT_450750 [Aspergillus piperis CBS 112811]RAH56098.1 hypothetical protein BO85DRAFT_450750 [Aspergillus piperis CBS 112811]
MGFCHCLSLFGPVWPARSSLSESPSVPALFLRARSLTARPRQPAGHPDGRLSVLGLALPKGMTDPCPVVSDRETYLRRSPRLISVWKTLWPLLRRLLIGPFDQIRTVDLVSGPGPLVHSPLTEVNLGGTLKSGVRGR